MARPIIYRFSDMEIDGRQQYGEPNKFPSIRAALSIYSKKSGRKFQTKTQTGILWIRRIA